MYVWNKPGLLGKGKKSNHSNYFVLYPSVIIDAKWMRDLLEPLLKTHHNTYIKWSIDYKNEYFNKLKLKFLECIYYNFMISII